MSETTTDSFKSEIVDPHKSASQDEIMARLKSPSFDLLRLMQYRFNCILRTNPSTDLWGMYRHGIAETLSYSDSGADDDLIGRKVSHKDGDGIIVNNSPPFKDRERMLTIYTAEGKTLWVPISECFARTEA